MFKFFLCFVLLGCLASLCGAELWKCDNNQEIRIEYLCDGFVDCGDESDENLSNCAHRKCKDDEFQCANSRCIHSSFRCDEEADCQGGDESDEEGCDEEIDVCHGNTFRCLNNSECFPAAWRCDHETDCKDGSDEFDCPCPDNLHKCVVIGRSICLATWALCDGVQHCDDGSDEHGCVWNKLTDWECPPNTYKCAKVSECVPLILVCDGHRDCRDESDEGGLCHAESCLGSNYTATNEIEHHAKICSTFCTQTPIGAQCSCKPGYMLSEDKSMCKDIDECETDGFIGTPDTKIADEKWCSQKCINTEGSFVCACEPGYELDFNGYHCKATGVEPPKLYFAANNQIRELTLRGSLGVPSEETKVYESYSSDETIVSISYHSDYKLLFWVEQKSQAVKMRDQFGVVKNVLAAENGFVPFSVSVDWIGQSLFYSSVKSLVDGRKEGKVSVAKIERTKPFGTSVDILAGLIHPVAIALCPHKGFLFVADRGTKGLNDFDPEILLLKVDGSNRKTLVKQNLLPPTAVAFEHVHSVLYFASSDRQGARVERVNIDGTNRMILLVQQSRSLVTRPWSLSLFEGNLYLADRSKQEIEVWEEARSSSSHADADMKLKPIIKLSKMARMTALTIAHPVLQKSLPSANPCESKMCASVCVVVSKIYSFSIIQYKVPSAKCLCPKGTKLIDDRKCVGEIPIPDKVGSFPFTATSTTTSTTTTTPFSSTTRPTPFSSATKTSTATRTEVPVLLHAATPCHFPGSVEHATIHPLRMRQKTTNSTFGGGTTIIYKCHREYTVQGTHAHMRTLKCLANGKWNAEKPRCGRIHAVETLYTNDPCEEHVCSDDEECKINQGQSAECVCSYGIEKTTNLCIPAQNMTPAKKASKRTSPKVVASIVVILIMLAISAVVFCKCYKRRLSSRSTINLQYTRGRLLKSTSKDSSITNPNYVSPAFQGRRTLKIDGQDSGLDHTSSSSNSSLDESLQRQGQQELMSDFSDMQDATTSSQGGRLSSQLATIFSLRKTESREAIIPK